MSSAFGEPPLSGVKRSADAPAASTSGARRATSAARPSARRGLKGRRDWSIGAGSYLSARRRDLTWRGEVGDRRPRGASTPAERGRALLQEGGDALREVLAAGRGGLLRGLE